MAGPGKPGPDARYPIKIGVKVDADLLDFLDGLAEATGTNRAVILRALAEAHRNYLMRLATEYVKTKESA
jgi:hypothetical protein